MSTLHKISGCDDEARRADVVFLHGLGGDAFTTWRYGEDDSTSWPCWMGEEFPEVGVWSLGYAASPTMRFSWWRRLFQGFSAESSDIGHALSLPDRAGQVLDLMVNRGFGARPILFVCHSLGGLLAKQLLRKAGDSRDDAKKHAIFDHVRAVLFLATPHAGAKIASIVTSLSKIAGPTASMRNLQVDDAHLRDLHDWYRQHSADPGIETRAYFETKACFHVKIVSESSAHPGVGPAPVGLDEDHLSIAKPRQADEQVCDTANDLLRNHVLVSRAQGGMPPLPIQDKLPSEFRIFSSSESSKLPKGAELLIGRDAEIEELDRALTCTRTHIIEFVAFGGVGKSALVVDWMGRLSANNWPGIECYLEWSFYSQGTRDQGAVSSDVFIAKALAFFGDPDPQLGSAHDRGNRLAELVAQQPTVLILDGLEPLQYGSGPLKGQLKDPAVLALLKGFAQRPFDGLCVLTTREVLTDLQAFHKKTVVHHPLEHLSNTAGAALLHQSGATRRGASNIKENDKELKAASDEVKGHALTLSLLGGYLKLAHDGDIDRRNRVGFEEADEEIQGGHAFRTIAAYEHWLEATVLTGRGGDPIRGPRQVSILRLLGLFDRPASAECLEAIRQAPAITGLTERLVGLEEKNWKIAVTSLEDLDLVSNQKGTLDAHPLVREYFAKQLREKQNKAWTEGHRRLYEHLCETTEKHPDTIEGLLPLYQAVAHGCQAGLYQQACEEVYFGRILRGTGHGGFYSTKMLGAIGADLGAVACFFDPPWHRITPKITADSQPWLLNEAAFSLAALGRLTEALEPMRAGLELDIKQAAWNGAARMANNLSELELTLGAMREAQSDAEQSVTFADRSNDKFLQMCGRTTHGDALHQSGHEEAARTRFVEAEILQRERQPKYPRLYSLWGFRYCDLLLSESERLAWRQCMALSVSKRAEGLWLTKGSVEKEHRQACEEVSERATQALELVGDKLGLLETGRDHLILSRTALYRWLIEAGEVKAGRATTLGPTPPALTEHLTSAVNGLRESGDICYLPRALLTQAWSNWATNPTAAAANLDEAWEIAERGPMPLFQADILLTRARLFFREDLATAKDNLAEARRLIEKHGYHRRDQELKDAETALRVAEGN